MLRFLFVLLSALTVIATNWAANVQTPRLLFTIHLKLGNVRSVRFSPDGKTLGACSGEITLAEVATGGIRTVLKFDKADFELLEFFPDGKAFVTTDRTDKTIKIVDLATGKVTVSLYGGGSDVDGLALAADGKLIATSLGEIEQGTIVKLWDVAKRQELLSFDRVKKQTMYSVAFSPDGKKVAAAGGHTPLPSFGEIQLWDISKRQLSTVLRGHKASVRCIAFSPGGNTLVSGSYDGIIRLWDVSTAKLTACWHTRMESVSAVAFSPDGRILAVGGDNTDPKEPTVGIGKVCFLDATTGQQLGEGVSYKRQVGSIAFSPNCKLLAVSGGAPVVDVWDVSGLVKNKDVEPRK